MNTRQKQLALLMLHLKYQNTIQCEKEHNCFISAALQVHYQLFITFASSLHSQAFQDETRRIKADTAALLQRARSVVPRASSVAPLDPIFS